MGHDTIRIGIVGAGANTRARHLPGLQAIDGVEIRRVCNRSRESSKRVAGEFDIPAVADHWRDIVDDPELDAVVIGTWPYMHCPITLAALAAGKHVMTEARMAMNAAEARMMRDAAVDRPDLVAQIVPSPMTLEVDATIQRLLAEGYPGQVLAVEVRAGGAWLDRDAPLHWREDTDLSGLNVMSLGIWYEAVLRWIGHAKRVTAMGETFVKTRKDDRGFVRAVGVPDHLNVVAEMACGAQLSMRISNVAALGGGPEVYLFGSEGTLRFADDALYGGRRGDDALERIDIPEDERGTWRVEQDFIDAIRGQGTITLTDFETGLKYMEFTEAVVRSMASGATISLPVL